MHLTEIENLSAADLKSRRDELVEAAKAAEQGELAARYVKARTDAKLRDEKLAEQARTLDALSTGLESAKVQAADQSRSIGELEDMVSSRESERNALARNLHAAHQAHSAELATLQQEHSNTVDDLRAELAETAQQRDSALSLAKARRAALADVMSHANGLATKVAPLLAEEG